MTKDTFHMIWEIAVCPSAKNIMESLSPENVSDNNVVLDIGPERESEVYRAYERIRKRVRTQFFNGGTDLTNRIDIHKIAACLTEALIVEKVISYSGIDGKIPVELVLSNYAIAFYAGVYCLYISLLSGYHRDKKNDEFKKLFDRHCMIFPDTNPGHDGYVYGRIKTLALNDLYGVDFDILTYADMLFWIELYNRKSIES